MEQIASISNNKATLLDERKAETCNSSRAQAIQTYLLLGKACFVHLDVVDKTDQMNRWISDWERRWLSPRILAMDAPFESKERSSDKPSTPNRSIGAFP